MNDENQTPRPTSTTREKSLQELLGVAIQSEIEAAETYRELLARELPKETRSVIERLVSQEEEHEESFRDILNDFYPNEEISLPEGSSPESSLTIEESASAEDLIQASLEAEKKAEEFYSDLTDEFEDKEVRRLLGYMAATEREHYEILKSELEKLQ